MSAVDVDTRLRELVAAVESPGAVVGVMHGDRITVHAAGLANSATGQEMTADTCVPIASISKVFTATLAMQLVDEGLLDLDTPVRSYLPDFRVADPAASESLTARQLLTHSAGIDGDKEDGYGRGDDAVGRFVSACADLGQIHPPGVTYSYCNSGLIILGHLVAVLRGMTWDKAVRDHIFRPLALRAAGTLAEDVVQQRFAAGHPSGPDTGPGSWELERAHGPAGGVMCSAGDLLTFAAAHFDHGPTSACPVRLLSGDAARAMRTPQIALPNPYEGETHWGLGWGVTRVAGQPDLIGHTGDLLGYHSRLLLCPESHFAFALLTNGNGADEIAESLLPDLLEGVGLSWPAAPGPPEVPPDVDLDAVSGIYETLAVRVTLTRRGDHLRGRTQIIAPRVVALLPESQRTYESTLVPVDQTLFVRRDDDDDEWSPAVFSRSGDDAYLHIGGRAFRRRAPG